MKRTIILSHRSIGFPRKARSNLRPRTGRRNGMNAGGAQNRRRLFFCPFCPPVSAGGFYAENAECWHECKQPKTGAALRGAGKIQKAAGRPFDVPGHKRGRGNPELVELLGEKCVGMDVNSMKPLDNLCHPVSVILEAEALAAEAFGAENAFFMVGGTTSSVQSMVLSACKAGDKIILPRNVHRSVINALVLCGAEPVYVNPKVDNRLGISLGMELCDVERAILENPTAVAVLVNNPTYYGICSNIREIVRLAHEHGMLALADEAHGTHFYFGKNLPVSAIAAGADMSAVSMHKSGGSLTQSSLLLLGKNVSAGYVSQIINLTQTTSASYLLMSSLDISRRNLALRGESSFEKVTAMAEYARSEINGIGGYYAYGRELVNGNSIYDYDVTKLSVYTARHRAGGHRGVRPAARRV